MALAKLLNCRKGDEREQDQGAHEPEGAAAQTPGCGELETTRHRGPLAGLRPSGGSAGLQASELRRQTRMFGHPEKLSELDGAS